MSAPGGDQSPMENLSYAFSQMKIVGKEEKIEPIDEIIKNIEILFSVDLPVKDEITFIKKFNYF